MISHIYNVCHTIRLRSNWKSVEFFFPPHHFISLLFLASADAFRFQIHTLESVEVVIKIGNAINQCIYVNAALYSTHIHEISYWITPPFLTLYNCIICNLSSRRFRWCMFVLTIAHDFMTLSIRQWLFRRKKKYIERLMMMMRMIMLIFSLLPPNNGHTWYTPILTSLDDLWSIST